MKKVISLVVAFALCFSVPAFAGLVDDNSNHNTQGQAQGQLQGQLQGQAQGQIASSRSFSDSSARSSVSNKGNTNDISVGGDSENHVRGEMLAYSAPSLQASKGVSTSQMGSIFGSLTLSDSEQQEVESTRTDILLKLLSTSMIEPSVMKEQVTQIVDNLEFASRPKRFLGFGWKTQGKSLENVFGILSWTSFRGNKKK